MKNYYLILGVSRRADPAKIKRAFRNIAKQHHPDVAGSDEGIERFLQVQEAYEVLSDQERRKRYDESLDREENREGVRRRRGMKRFHFRAGGRGVDAAVSDNLFNDLFAGLFGARKDQEREIYFELTLSPQEAEDGGYYTITLPLVKPCPQCIPLWGDPFCPLCGGRGKVHVQQDVSFHLPPQVYQSTEFRLPLRGIGLPGNYLNLIVRIDFDHF